MLLFIRKKSLLKQIDNITLEKIKLEERLNQKAYDLTKISKKVEEVQTVNLAKNKENADLINDLKRQQENNKILQQELHLIKSNYTQLDKTHLKILSQYKELDKRYNNLQDVIVEYLNNIEVK